MSGAFFCHAEGIAPDFNIYADDSLTFPAELSRVCGRLNDIIKIQNLSGDIPTLLIFRGDSLTDLRHRAGGDH